MDFILLRLKPEPLPTMGDGRLAEPHAHRIQILEIAVGKIRVALGKIVDGLIHPMPLIVLLGLKDATTVDVTEKLVSSPIDHVLLRHVYLHL